MYFLREVEVKEEGQNQSYRMNNLKKIQYSGLIKVDGIFEVSIHIANMIIQDPAISANSIEEQIQAEDDANLSVSLINSHLCDGIIRYEICKFAIKKLKVHQDA
ncbi:MAG: hypothetical protein EZS28_042505 [Streblomastix strix]|uniref:Uncharacterized protein n=1 Tax=Streblomastix strix TaxID=222440 RepID=A0A5J4TUX6_9EUKA|nr:MAG: hypothetical protein EZS28_042505 [Streblomastix strix]